MPGGLDCFTSAADLPAAPGGGIQTIIAAVESVVAYAIANEKSLLELDINPLIVTPDAAIAADALIVKAGCVSPDEGPIK